MLALIEMSDRCGVLALPLACAGIRVHVQGTLYKLKVEELGQKERSPDA
jgi:hypothetical protein